MPVTSISSRLTTEAEARSALGAVLRSVGVERGDTLYLGVDMARVILPRYPAALDRESMRARAEKWCAFLLSVLLDAVGPDGTLLAPTFTYAYARLGTPYEHETSPSETGPFTEHLRRQPSAVRSLHPLNSIAGLGRRAREILGDTGRAGYGARSPFARLAANETKFLFLGANLGIALTHAHHLEHMYGVNHMYHKLYRFPVRKDGMEVPGPWLCFVRYLGVGIEPRIGALEERLRSRGLLAEAGPLETPVQLARCADVEAIGYQMLDENPAAFLTNPVDIQVADPGAAQTPAGPDFVRFVRARGGE